MAGSGAENILISPVNVLWRIEARHCIEHVADSSDSLNGTYYTLMGTHYVWFNNSGVDPAPAGLTAIPVVYSTDDSAATIATAAQAAIDALGDFGAVVESDGVTVTVTAAAVGEKTDSADVDSGVSVTIVLKGKNYDLGLLQGDVAPTFAPATFDVQAHQQGVTLLSKIFQGIETLEVTTELQETGRSKLKELYKIWGGAFTPGAGTEVFGAGTGQIGKNMLIEAARLEMSPVNSSLSSEQGYDYSFMLALPVPDTLTFSGENPRILSVTWSGFPNLALANADTNALVVGDATQSGL